MRTLIALIGIMVSVQFSRAQVAPDFTVTDIDGQVHHLYADYLNQGKSVMIKIMFTTCPPCNSIAPLMEPFYQEWGAGEYDVEFFEMTDKSFDNNSLMAAYANQYNETFPAISTQGNSLPTVQPYKNGTFGPFYGTPTFIVIAPNGSVQFDVDGANNQATIDAIDAALSATGALKPGQVVHAPDFNVTDSHGQTHQLYADYLNLGKSVVLEIFNTTDPASNSIAPLLELFYQDWGAGNNDVEFLAMSDSNGDTNPTVNSHQSQYGQTFVGVSKDGGSLAAVAPYKNGQFGTWDGPPTFVVIAPDGTFAYDVDGATNQETINELNSALLATGAENPPTVFIAPDFTITDSHGQIHHLYADYLNQGKTVLLEVFYTTCPPCNSIAPLLEPFYQEWGAGAFDVEFFELSDKNFDTDALVNAYQATYGETFIGAGKDGGSLQAVAPYKNGQFGTWYGTPTFMVISPDGSFVYDVDGSNNQNTIDSLDAAITATGAIKPAIEQPVMVTGQVQFLQGSLGVNHAYVQVLDTAGNIVVADTTGSSGTFNLSILLSEVQPGWKLKAVKNGAVVNGVSVFDLVKMQRHILFLEPLSSPLAKLAADVNKSGTINAFDIIALQKIILGINSNFSDGATWIVLPADTDFGPPTQNPPVIGDTTILLEDILNGNREPNWIAVKKGDVNLSADPSQ
ncbi:MAG TPA: redoxin domain-containing protein [Saprospiraceae bacterium]|nr:redoxin domain-containing protein [Saprospiraceae bacterium]